MDESPNIDRWHKRRPEMDFRAVQSGICTLAHHVSQYKWHFGRNSSRCILKNSKKKFISCSIIRKYCKNRNLRETHSPFWFSVKPTRHLHQAAWRSGSQYAFGPHSKLLHGLMHVPCTHASESAHSLLLWHWFLPTPSSSSTHPPLYASPVIPFGHTHL